jgi:hypothetical protein
MAGISVGEAKGARRSVEADVNMIPMIDLLVVTIGYLLLTAVYAHYPRLEASARVPGTGAEPCTENCKVRELHLDMGRPDALVFTWKENGAAVSTRSIPKDAKTTEVRGQKVVRFEGLRDALEGEWKEHGAHQTPDDRAFDHLIIATGDDTAFAAIAAAMDAAHGVVRPLRLGEKTATVPAMTVSLATR